MASQPPREATKVIKLLRNFFMRRNVGEQLRYENFNQQPRSTPLPKLPGGVSHKMSANDYHTRDARGASEPPQLVFTLKDKMITAGGAQQASGQRKSRHPTPGQMYDYGRFIPYNEELIHHKTS